MATRSVHRCNWRARRRTAAGSKAAETSHDPYATVRLAIEALLSPGPLPGPELLRQRLHAACSRHEAVRRGLTSDGNAGATRPIHLVLVAASLMTLVQALQPEEVERATKLGALVVGSARAYCLQFSAARALLLALAAKGALRSEDAARHCRTASPTSEPDLALQPVDGFRAIADSAALAALCRTLVTQSVAVSPGCSGCGGGGFGSGDGSEGGPGGSGGGCVGVDFGSGGGSRGSRGCGGGGGGGGGGAAAHSLLDPALLRAAAAEARAEHLAGRLAPSRVKSAASGNVRTLEG